MTKCLQIKESISAYAVGHPAYIARMYLQFIEMQIVSIAVMSVVWLIVLGVKPNGKNQSPHHCSNQAKAGMNPKKPCKKWVYLGTSKQE